MTETDSVPAHDCKMCGQEITGIHPIGSWKDRNGIGGGVWYDGRCETCDIDFRLDIGTKAVGGWRMLAPDRECLVEPLDERELEKLDGKLSRYKKLGEKWRCFRSKCREDDQFWRYRDGKMTGVAIVRDGTPIASYRIFAGS